MRAISDGAEEQLQAMQEQVDTAEHSKRYAQAALAEERTARKTVERALREMTERAERAEAALRLLEQETGSDDRADDTVALQPLPQTATRYGEGKAPARRGRPPGSKAAVKPAILASSEAEPIKWWLMPSGKAKAR